MLTPSLLGFVEASVAEGFKRVSDFNGAEQNGAGGYPVNVVDGVRQSTALTYLTAPVRNRPNLAIAGGINVDRVLFKGERAVGVLTAHGSVYRAGEVILSGGTYGSAAILLRSGVGPAADLRSLGIEVVTNLPVGQRLHDQPFFYNAYALAPEHLQMTPAVGSLLWTASSEAIGDELDLHITATHLLDGSYSPTGGAIVLAISVVRPQSRGTLRLASTDPADAPIIDDNYLGTDRDARRMLEGVRLARAIARNQVFAPFTAGEILPGDAVGDDAPPEVIASNLAVYGHPTSTVPMGGLADPWAVVDAVGVVEGLAGLRVVDASIIPEVPPPSPTSPRSCSPSASTSASTPGDLMRDLLGELDRWRREGVTVPLARVVDLDGSGPREPGAAMAVNERGAVIGSVSGGCVAGAVVAEALEVLQTGDRKLVRFGYSDDDAFAVGLTCGGTVHLFVEPLDW
jgi:choline dehydrogenase